MNSNTFIASRCVCCGRRLTDELSIQCGMGPVCRKGHGFEKRDAESDWGSALLALGANAPADLYDAIVDAYGVLAMKGVPPYSLGFTAESYTSFKDASKAVKFITQRLSTAIERGLDKEQIVRCIAAVNELGYVRLARVFAKGFRRRRDFRERYDIQSIDIVRTHTIDEQYLVSSTYNTTFLDQLRAKVDYSKRAFNRITKEYTITCTKAVLLDIVKHSGFTFVSGITPKFDVDGGPPQNGDEFVRFNKKFIIEPPCPPRLWEPEGAEEDRCWWVNEHGEAVRVVIPGEPTHRPGMEKVGPLFFTRPSQPALLNTTLSADEVETQEEKREEYKSALASSDHREPPPGSWASVAREMVRSGMMSGDEADAWKDEMKEGLGEID